MAACTEILIAEVKDKNPCGHCGDGTRIPTRTARCRICSPFHFLLSPFCWRSRPTRDPIGYRGGINLYGYVNSSPVGNVDAKGMQVLAPWPASWAPPSPAIGGSDGKVLEPINLLQLKCGVRRTCPLDWG